MAYAKNLTGEHVVMPLTTKGSIEVKTTTTTTKDGEGPELEIPESLYCPHATKARGRNSVLDPGRGSRSRAGFQIPGGTLSSGREA